MIYEILHRLFSDPGDKTEHFLAEVAAEIPEIPRLTDQDLHSAEEVDRHAATREEWGVDRDDVILETPHTRAQARDLIDHIGRQGEGFPGDADSHFMEFIETLDAFENGLISVIPLPESPSLMAGPGKERIENPYTRLWAEVMNYQYSLLVMAIFHAILIPRGDSAAETLRKGLADAALRGMRRVVKMLNATFISLPMKGPGTEPAGPPYHLEEGIMDSTKPAELIAVQLRLLDRLEEVYRKIEAAAEFAGRPDDSTSLTNLRNWDQRRRQLFDPPQ